MTLPPPPAHRSRRTDGTSAAWELWGEGTTTVAADSTHVRAYDQNIFTEWHSRYGGRGILIHWHIERGSIDQVRGQAERRLHPHHTLAVASPSQLLDRVEPIPLHVQRQLLSPR
ncbi:Tn3 family transposase [Streptosporangium canum]|uniref:Tn3 family transposase n=1 Tax=Streptosporangium canum TaxID=324952 RepID=UPI0033B0CCB9